MLISFSHYIVEEFNMKNLSLLILFFLPLSDAFAQWYKPEKVGKKTASLYSKALEYADDGKYPEAIAGIKEVIKSDSMMVDAYLSRAGIYATIKDYNNSVLDFEKAMILDSVYSAQYNLPYSISLAGKGEFEKALEAINKFASLPSLNERSRKAATYRREVYEFALLQKGRIGEDYVLEMTNLGPRVNSENLEYYPSITIDGERLIFTRRVNNDEDFYECRLIRGEWTAAEPVEGKINTNLNEGAQNISQDGEWLIFTGCNYPEGEGSCDLYIAYFNPKTGWTEPKNLGYGINTEYWESAPSLSPDKRVLYFSSNRPGGYGGKDIWMTMRTPEGKWTQPRNMGPDINTSGDETCPFIHADNQSLYFNSNGHPGYGSSDIFLSRKGDDGEWGIPENLGYPVNSIDEEGSLIVAADGVTAYYASDRSDGKGGLDLYAFRLPDTVKAYKTFWVKGRVFDKKTMKGLPSAVELTDINTRNVLYRLQTDEDGNYLVPLPEGKDFAFNVNRKGYLMYSENFSMTEGKIDAPRIINIPLQPLEPGASVVLKNIFFDLNKFSLREASAAELDKVIGLLKENPSLKVEIIGHTDNAGKDADNLTLSMNRAKSVTDYLVAGGIDKSRLTSRGYGASRPLATNDTEEGRALNRRTELKVISN